MRALLLVLTLASAAAPFVRADDDGVVVTAPAGPSSSAPAAAPQDAEARYQMLLARAKASAPESDWLGLRFAYADRPTFKAFGQDLAKSAMFKAVEAGDCTTALADAKAVIAQAFVDADAHLIAAYCDDRIGDSAAAKWERDVGVGLLKSIETGDGLSPATAFTVIDVDEEYALMRARGLKVTNQALVQQGGHTYDALTATNGRGESATYFFLIDKVLAREAASLKPGAEDGPPAPVEAGPSRLDRAGKAPG